jgi:hypothetical protein
MGPTSCKTKLHCELDLSGRLGSGRERELGISPRKPANGSPNSASEYNRPKPLRESTDNMIVCQSFSLFVIDFWLPETSFRDTNRPHLNTIAAWLLIRH